MKMLIKSNIIAAFFCLIVFSGTQHVQAQNLGVTLGAGYGTEIESVGIQGGVIYSFTPEIRSAVDFVYFLPKDEGGLEFQWMEINANAHYLLVNSEDLRLYALAGVNYAMLETEFTFMGNTVSGSNQELGANIGAGGEYLFSPAMGLYLEAKYVLGNADQLGAFGGLRFFF